MPSLEMDRLNMMYTNYDRDSSSESDIVPRKSHSGAAYLMIESATVQNFRSFANAELTGLRRVNVILGDNGAGKTALMEALFMALVSSPQIALHMRGWRGLPVGGIATGHRNLYESLWGDLFHNFDIGKLVSVSLNGSDGSNRSVQIYRSNTPTLLPLNVPSPTGAATTSAPVTFEWKNASGEPIISTPLWQPPMGISIPPTPDSPISAGFYAVRNPFSSYENATFFSNLSRKGDEGKFVAAMRRQFPDIENINVEVEMGSPMLFVKFKWAKEKSPIGVLSDGMNKVAAILLALATHRRGAIFLDEVESGIYFRRHGTFWKQITEFSEAYETQVFATTHSFEAIRSLVPVMERHSDLYSVIRVHSENGISTVTMLHGKEALDLIASGLELRV